jgi:NAD(P)-dependent dehydrogenase (short-subunit alcohol dehydrogenase family)
MPLGPQMDGRATSSGLDSPVRTKVAIVTGASRGIGRGIAERLLETGYCVVANSRNITSAKTLQPGDRLKLVDGDIASHNVAKQVVDSAIGNFGRIDLLVNNAGVFIPKPFTEYTTEDFHEANGNKPLGILLCFATCSITDAASEVRAYIVNITSSIVDQPVAGVTGSLVNLTRGTF